MYPGKPTKFSVAALAHERRPHESRSVPNASQQLAVVVVNDFRRTRQGRNVRMFGSYKSACLWQSSEWKGRAPSAIADVGLSLNAFVPAQLFAQIRAVRNYSERCGPVAIADSFVPAAALRLVESNARICFRGGYHRFANILRALIRHIGPLGTEERVVTPVCSTIPDAAPSESGLRRIAPIKDRTVIFPVIDTRPGRPCYFCLLGRLCGCCGCGCKRACGGGGGNGGGGNGSVPLTAHYLRIRVTEDVLNLKVGAIRTISIGSDSSHCVIWSFAYIIHVGAAYADGDGAGSTGDTRGG